MISPPDLPKYQALLELANRYPDLDIASVETCLAFLRTSAEVYGVLDVHFADHQLSMGKFIVVMLLMQAGPTGLTPSDCAERAGVTRGTITGLLDGLERENWIRREPYPQDRRRLMVVLTESGLERLDAMLPGHFRMVADMLGELTTDEKALLKKLLIKFRNSTLTLPESQRIRRTVATPCCDPVSHGDRSPETTEPTPEAEPGEQPESNGTRIDGKETFSPSPSPVE